MNPVIRLSPEVEVKLTAWTMATNGKEFSGLGTVVRLPDNMFYIEDVWMLGVGSGVFTQFAPERQMAIQAEPGTLKCWFHRHPVGDGVPGPHNWSGTDEATATKSPLGSDPRLVQWSIAIVRTPRGWVGRIDIHLPKLTTFHCAVEPNLPSPEVEEAARELITEELKAYMDELYNEYLVMERASRQSPRQTTFYPAYENQDAFWEADMEETGFYCDECNTELEFGDADDAGFVEYYICPNCQQTFVRVVDGKLINEVQQSRRSQPAWKASKWWKNILGGRNR